MIERVYDKKYLKKFKTKTFCYCVGSIFLNNSFVISGLLIKVDLFWK